MGNPNIAKFIFSDQGPIQICPENHCRKLTINDKKFTLYINKKSYSIIPMTGKVGKYEWKELADIAKKRREELEENQDHGEHDNNDDL